MPNILNYNRDIAVDIAKGICIILVVIGHFVPVDSPVWYQKFIDTIYTFHMPLFMFASGYIYMLTKRDGEAYGSFVMKKVNRLVIPYFSASIIIITIKLLSENILRVDHPSTVISYLQMFYLPEAGYFLWFIWALWWNFLIIGLCGSRLQRSIIAGVSVILYLLPIDITNIFAINQFKGMLIFFMAGVMVVDWKKNLAGVFNSIPSWTMYLIFIILEIVFVWQDVTFMKDAVMKIIPFIGIAAVMLFSKQVVGFVGDHAKWLLTVSGCSYIIYLFHTTVEGFCKAIISHFIDSSASTMLFIIECLIVIIPAVVIPIFIQKQILQRSRILSFLFGLKYK